ncbi:MAG: hypothetical protein HYV97_14140 [Bdellovibrio sp.]|nr:hypothetical protein [Bdellovibrio sp.]
MGTSWAEIIQVISGESGLIKYCHKIVFEETRNIELYYDLISTSKSALQLAQSLILSIKKWELKCLPNHTKNWIDGHESYLVKPDLTNEDFLSASTLTEAYRSWFFFKKHKIRREELKELFQRKHNQNNKLTTFLRHSGTSGYDFMVALELSLDVLDWNEINRLKVRNVPTETGFIPRFERYVYDCHTWAGKALLKKHFDKFIRDDDLEGVGLDLRFSGLITALYKREKAFEIGEQEWIWDKVKIEATKLKGVMNLERLFYSSIFSQSRKN